MNKKILLTELEAYKAMFKFLEIYYRRTLSDDVGSLLGDMQFLDDRKTADPAVWHEWMNIIYDIAQGNKVENLTKTFKK